MTVFTSRQDFLRAVCVGDRIRFSYLSGRTYEATWARRSTDDDTAVHLTDVKNLTNNRTEGDSTYTFGYDCDKINLTILPTSVTPNSQPQSLMSSIASRYRALFATAEDKLLTKYNIESPIGVPTEEGFALLREILYAERRADVIAKVQAIADADAAENDKAKSKE